MSSAAGRAQMYPAVELSNFSLESHLSPSVSLGLKEPGGVADPFAVETVRLDSYLEAGSSVGVTKIDVEGHEAATRFSPNFIATREPARLFRRAASLTLVTSESGYRDETLPLESLGELRSRWIRIRITAMNSNADVQALLAGMSASKRDVLERTREYLMPARVDAFLQLGVPLVIGRRQGYRLWDVDGHELLDLHLNGGTYNLGHRNPEVLAALQHALESLDIGNHHFPSASRADLAEALAQLTPGELHYSVFVPSGSEANDLAIRIARHATGRRKIVALDAAFHGRTGLASAAGQDDSARFFRSDYPDEFVKVPFGDLTAMEQALAGRDVAAVLMETIPATYGFPVPADDYLPGVARLCRESGTLYVADEVQTGLGRSGRLWAIETWGIEPDVLVTGKGLSGGVYPIAAVVMTKTVGRWLSEQGWGYVSTFGGAEIGCAVGLAVLAMCNRPESLANARRIAAYLRSGLDDLRVRHRRLRGVRQLGLVMGLEIEGQSGALELSRALYRRGVWAMFSGFDLSVLQFKPGLLVDESYCDILLERLDAGLGDLER